MIVVKITDGLGNQMFQYAYAKSLQICLSKNVYLDISDINNIRHNNQQDTQWTRLCDRRQYELDGFSISLPVIDEKKAIEMCRRSGDRSKFLNYCEQLRLLPTVYLKESECRETGIRYTSYQNYYVEGYFFDKIYSDSIKNALRKEFKLKKRLCLPKKIEEILKTRNTVSLHIRRGDFLKVGRNISENNYYDRAIKYVENRLKDVFLLVFSDDIEWVRMNRKFKTEHLFISNGEFTDNEEMTLMSMCSHNIIANSTFSYWGAWLNSNSKKLVIAPKGWRQKVIPESWIAL
ncbi:MAG: alpha-1,2-fucosyltransferase [Lachnospiraceae bacterium]|nr:alpha-1,2-fucosyltransferase [Lachnospiraceae bacterium]